MKIYLALKSKKQIHHFFTWDFLHKNAPPQNRSRNSIHSMRPGSYPRLFGCDVIQTKKDMEWALCALELSDITLHRGRKP